MLELILQSEIWGSYKDLEIEMRLNNLKEVEILETRYCFKKIEGYRKLSYKDVGLLARMNELEKIKNQSLLTKRLD